MERYMVSTNNLSSNSTLVILIAITIFFFILFVAIINYKKQNQTDKKQQTIKPKETQNNTTDIINDPAMIRMSMEESKADLSQFNVKENKSTQEEITNLEPIKEQEIKEDTQDNITDNEII